MIVFAVLLLILVVYQLRFCPKGFYDCLHMENNKSLRGICALVVVMHHLSGAFHEGDIFFTIFFNVGFLAVSIFFFSSGYGLMKSYMNKENYVKGFFSRRVMSIALPYAFYIMIYWIISVLRHDPYTFGEVMASLFNGHPIVTFSWYILVSLFFYIFFYLMMRIFKKNYAGILGSSLIFFILRAVFCYMQNRGTHWYISSFCVPLGILVAMAENLIIEKIRRHYTMYFILSSILMVVAFAAALIIESNGFIDVFISVCSSIIFVVFVHLLTMKFSSENKLWKCLSHISLEVYLTHPLIMRFLRSDLIYIENNVIWGLSVIAVTIPAAWIIHLMVTKLQKLFANKAIG